MRNTAKKDEERAVRDRIEHGARPWRAMLPLAVLIVLVAVVAAPGLGLGVPPLFGPGEELLHAAVILGLSMIGAVLLAFGLLQLAWARQQLGEVADLLDAADAEEARARASLERVDALLAELGAEARAGR